LAAIVGVAAAVAAIAAGARNAAPSRTFTPRSKALGFGPGLTGPTAASRRIALVARSAGLGSQGIEAAVAVGKEIDKQKRRVGQKDQKQLRLQELRWKVDLLKGKRIERYKQQRDKERGEAGDDGDGAAEEDEDDEDDENEMTEAEAEAEAALAAAAAAISEVSEAQSSWSFERDGPKLTPLKKMTAEGVSDDARAIASTELAGNGKARAASIIEAATEYKQVRKLDKATKLLEIARIRIDREQIERKIDLATSQVLDNQVMWLLAETYEEDGRLTMACNCFHELMQRPRSADQERAAKEWGRASFKVSEKLYDIQRFEEAYEVVELLRAQTTMRVHGSAFLEDVELQAAMTLQKMGKVIEARQVLVELVRTSKSRKRKGQAQFILDVFSVEPDEEYRNEEFHKVWDAHFVLPSESRAGQVRVGGSSNFGTWMTPNEREFRKWATDYWQDRLSSPLYYAFLTLFVTWPFAIPVVSIMKRMNAEQMVP